MTTLNIWLCLLFSRLTKERYEERIIELTANQELLQHLVDDKEEEFERKMKTRVAEQKSEWDLAEEELREEIRKLKGEVGLI